MSRLLGFELGDGRSGIDAFFKFEADQERYATPIELKSTTKESVSTARDVGPDHIIKWRSRVWVFGFYIIEGSEPILKKLLALGPTQMEPWIAEKEKYIAPDFAIAERAAARLTLRDVRKICEEKAVYTLDDAESLHKRQWSKRKYHSEMDVARGYSPDKMLEILQHRTRYLIRRGATLNNPHIPKRFFEQFGSRMLDVEEPNINQHASLIRAQIRSATLRNRHLRRIAREFGATQ